MGMTRLMARASATDRLSALSDDVLLDHIFTKISYTDVIRSSILSQRWRFLWRKTPILKFCRQDFEKQKDDRILAIINNALLHLDARLLYFNLRIALDDPKAADINTWIRLAAEKKVERMELHISYRDPNRTLNASTIVELGETVFSFPWLEELTIHGQCFQEMISDEIPVPIAGLTLPNLKMVHAHIGHWTLDETMMEKQ
ncbi:hypothetical protein SUGI_0307270 [Cryptomeria japonica]|nr:hypothetical protein SUGI_0307270 [Cryptomeria japonica]